MTKAERKPYKLTGGQWPDSRSPRGSIPIRSARTYSKTNTFLSLDRLGLTKPAGAHDWRLTELGQRVFARLSLGGTCMTCGRPLAFIRRVNISPSKESCEPCIRNKSREANP